MRLAFVLPTVVLIRLLSPAMAQASCVDEDKFETPAQGGASAAPSAPANPRGSLQTFECTEIKISHFTVPCGFFQNIQQIQVSSFCTD